MLKANVLTEPALVGRERELEELYSFLSSALEGQGKMVLIEGEAGSGKTRLACEFLRQAKEKGVGVLVGRCLSDAATPYFPFVEAFHAYFSSLDENEQLQSQQKLGSLPSASAKTRWADEECEIAALLIASTSLTKTGRTESVSPQVWKDHVYPGIADALHSMTNQQPLILFIDDIQWADSASLSLLHYLARAVQDSEKILILATFRSEELSTDAEGHSHPLAEELRMMRREELFSEIKLSGLNPVSVLEIAKNMMGGSLQSDFAEKLAEESQGSPLFVVESLRMLHERRGLISENNEWRLAVDELSIPSKVKDIILRRLASLNFAQKRVLEAASVIGERFDPELLSIVLALDNLEVLETLNVIARSTSLICAEENCYRFDHASSRQTLLEELSPLLKRGYHARLAERLETQNRDSRLSFSEIAYHYAQAGNKEKAAKFAMEAGKDALARFSNVEAIKHFTYFLQAVQDSPETAESRLEALESLGDAYSANLMYKEAFDVFEQLASSKTGKARLRAYRKAMDAVFFGVRNPTLFMDIADRAEPYATYDRLESARIRFQKGGMLPYEKRAAEFEAALQVFEEEYSLPDAARALMAFGGVAICLDQSEKGLIATLRSIALYEELGDLRGLRNPMFNAGMALVFKGLFIEAEEILVKAVQIGERIGIEAYGEIIRSNMLLGWALEGLGRLEEALSASLKAIEYSQKLESDKPVLGQIYSGLLRQYIKLGNLEHAEEYYWKLVNLPPETRFHFTNDPHSDLSHTYEIYRAQAIFFAANNRWKEANQYFEKALELEKTGLIWSYKVPLRTEYASALDKQGRNEEAKAQLEEAQKITAEIEERFAHVNLKASLMAPWKVVVGEEFEMRLDLVNASKKAGLLVKVESLIPPGFKVTDPPANCNLENSYVDMEKRSINPFQVVTVKLKLKTSNADTYELSPQISYIDETGENKICKPASITITVQPSKPKYEVLPGRIPTGFEELDALLFGGLPEHCAVALASPSTDERGLLVERFLEEGAMTGETTFYITAEAGNAMAMAEKYPSNFCLFICSPQAETIVQTLPNVFKLKGVENLTEIDIAFAKAFRTLSPSTTGSRRICIEVISDVLLQHHAINARRWLSALLPTLKTKGFTILAIVDPQMHPPEEVQAVLSVFDGEIRVTERETPEGTTQTLKIRKLINQRYSDKEIVLNKEALSD